MFELGDVVEGSRRVTPAQLEKIREYAKKYARILGVSVLPEVRIQDNVGSKWLGRTLFYASHPETTLMQLQRSILNDDETLERVIAHEMVHHAEFLELDAHAVSMLKFGIKPPSHGKRFHELAAKINASTRNDFVTEVSDSSYVTKVKSYYVLIRTLHDGRLAYAIAVSPSRKMKKAIELVLYQGGKYVKTDDPAFTQGPRIGDNRWAVPLVPEHRERLKALFDEAT